jgi:hypothetical protein
MWDGDDRQTLFCLHARCVVIEKPRRMRADLSENAGVAFDRTKAGTCRAISLRLSGHGIDRWMGVVLRVRRRDPGRPWRHPAFARRADAGYDKKIILDSLRLPG